MNSIGTRIGNAASNAANFAGIKMADAAKAIARTNRAETVYNETPTSENRSELAWQRIVSGCLAKDYEDLLALAEAESDREAAESKITKEQKLIGILAGLVTIQSVVLDAAERLVEDESPENYHKNFQALKSAVRVAQGKINEHDVVPDAQ